MAQPYCAGAIDLNDSVPNSHTTPLSYGTSQQRAYLTERKKKTKKTKTKKLKLH